MTKHFQSFRDPKGTASSGVPLTKGDGWGIDKGDRNLNSVGVRQNKSCIHRNLTKGGLEEIGSENKGFGT